MKMRNLLFVASFLIFSSSVAQAQMKNHARMAPLFLENAGQVSTTNGEAADNVLYYMQTPKLDFFVTNDGLTYVFKEAVYPEDYKYEPSPDKNASPDIDIRWHRVDVSFEGAAISRNNAKTTFNADAPGVSFYKANFQTGEGGMPVIEKLVFENAWPGIDIEFVVDEDHLKYNFILHPGADISAIKMNFKGQDDLGYEDGNLVITTSLGTIKEGELISFTESGTPLEIKSDLNENNLTFYSETDLSGISETIIIDPPLVWSTYYGGSVSDEALVMEYNSGNSFIYALFKTQSLNFPTLDAPGPLDYYQGSNGGSIDFAVVKYDEDGIINWATYVGGSGNDDPSNLFYNGTVMIVVGYTQSGDFPLQNQPGAFYDNTLGGGQDGFIMAFPIGDALLWSTYFGGSGNDKFTDVVFGNNRISAVGETFSADIPFVDPGGGAYFDNTTATPNAYLAEFDLTFAQTWGTYLGGSNWDVISYCDMDDAGRLAVAFSTFSNDIPLVNTISGSYTAPYVLNHDICLMTFNSSRANIWTTYVSGQANEWANDLIFDDKNQLYVVGVSYSADFPVSNALGAGYYEPVKKTGADGIQMMFSDSLALLYSSFFGGNSNDVAFGITIDSKKRIYVVGDAQSNNLDTINPYDGSYFDGIANGSYDGFLAEYDSTFNLRWATYLGGAGYDRISDVRVTPNDHIFTVGFSESLNHPVLDMGMGAYYDDAIGGTRDAILTKFIPCPEDFDTLYGTDSVCMNEVGQIYASGSGTSYLWSTTETTDTINPVITSDTIFTVAVVGPYGCIEVDTFMITMNPLPAYNFYGDTAVCINDSATIWVNEGYTSYAWEYGQTDSTMTYLPVATEYVDITVINEFGCVYTDSTLLTVHPLPVPVINGDTAVCLYDTATMVATGGVSYVWNDMSTDTMLQVSPVPVGTYDYYAIATDANTCSDTAFFSVEVLPLPTFWLGNDTILCTGDSLMLTANYTPGTYAWNTSEISQSIYADTTFTYSVVVTDSNMCQYSDSIDITLVPLPSYTFTGDTAVCLYDDATLIVDAGYDSYLWEYGSTTNTQVYTPAASEYVNIVVGDTNGCVYADSVYVTVHPLPVPTIIGDTAVCLNDTAYMYAGGGETYLWSVMSTDTMIYVSPSPAGIYNYFVIATDSNNCSDTAFHSVEIYPLPVFWLGNDTTLCQGDSLMLDASNPGADYLWSTSDTTQTIYVNATNTYYTVVTDGNSCQYTDSIDVDVIPYADATITDILYVCENMTPFDYTAAETGGTWSGTGITNSTNGTFDPSAAGVGFHDIYYVIGGFCGDADTSVIEVAEVPDILLYVTDENCPDADDGTIVIVASGGQTPYTYLLDTSLVSDTTTMLAPGTYLITVIDDRGCLDTTSATVNEEDFPCGEVGYYIPNIFSPNGDGDNDELFVRSNYIDEMHFLIYDRFGEKVYESRNPDEGWDGKYNGQPVQSGVYFYVFKADLIDGSYVEDSGNITVVR